MEGTIAYGWKLDLFLISDGWIRIEIIQVWLWNIDSFDLELNFLVGSDVMSVASVEAESLHLLRLVSV